MLPTTSRLLRAAGWPVAPFVLLSLLLAGLAGCGGSGSGTSSSASGGDSTPGEATGSTAVGPGRVLRDMIHAYRNATTYSDNARVRVFYEREGQPQEESVTQAVSYARPNELALRVKATGYEVVVVCDGARLVARILDPAVGDMGNQVVVREAPRRLTMDDLVTDELLTGYINGSVVPPLQLPLLLANDPLPDVLDKSVGKKLLEDGAIDGRPCYRVQVDAVVGQSQKGFLVYWIDKLNHVLRRLEYPQPMSGPGASTGIEKLRMRVDYEDAQLNGDLRPDDFTIEIPPSAEQVSFFVTAPPPPPVELKLYGTKPAAFAFRLPGGEEVTQESLMDHIAVLAWFTSDDLSRAMLKQLAEVRSKHADDKNLAFYAVWTPSDGAAKPESVLREWEIDVPLLVDPKLHSRDTFHIRGAPTIVVLGRDGTVQHAEMGLNPQLAASLPPIIEALRRNEIVASSERRQWESVLSMYQQQLNLARDSNPSAIHEMPRAEILPPLDPRHLKLERLWSCKQLKAPGNIVSVSTDDGPRLYVLDGWQTVCEIDGKGEVAARHELPLPEGAAVNYLRTAVDKQGRRWFAAAALMGRDVYILDQEFKLHATYPPVEQDRESIRDVQLADLTGNGEPTLLVGFWGSLGVHDVSLDGKNVWRNRVFPAVLSMAVTLPNELTGWRKVLVTGSRGNIVELNHHGNHVPPVDIDRRFVQYLYTAEYEGGDTQYCAISVDTDGKQFALGMAENPSKKLIEVWQFALPAGAMPNQIKWVTSGRILDGPGGQWLFAGPDGSVHMVNHDGAPERYDYWRVGEQLTGLAIALIDDRPVVVIATRDELTAWRVNGITPPKP